MTTGDTTTHILRVAEELFARHGLDQVSIRDITAAAGVSTSSLYHHFGSKQALVTAILEQRVHQLLERRAALVAALGAEEDLTLHQVVATFVRPTADMAADPTDGAANYVRFLAAVMADPGYAPLVAQVLPYAADELRMLARVTPHLSPAERELRFALAKWMVNQVLAQPGTALDVWLASRPGGRLAGAGTDLADELIEFLTGAFEAPPRAPSEPGPLPGT